MTRALVLSLWALLTVLLVGCEVIARVWPDRYAGAREALERLTRGNVRLVAAFVGWMWLGWHFFAR